MRKGAGAAVAALSVSVVSLTVALAQAAAPQAPAAGTAKPATVLQVMRGILFPSSNVVFAAQGTDPATIKKADDPALATDPLASTYGGWEAVANAGVALIESARLLEVPRSCSNGRPAPIESAIWKQGLTELRAAGQVALQAAQKMDQDAVLDASDKITTACATCHDRYREKAPRCME